MEKNTATTTLRLTEDQRSTVFSALVCYRLSLVEDRDENGRDDLEHEIERVTRLLNEI